MGVTRTKKQSSSTSIGGVASVKYNKNTSGGGGGGSSKVVAAPTPSTPRSPKQMTRRERHEKNREYRSSHLRKYVKNAERPPPFDYYWYGFGYNVLSNISWLVFSFALFGVRALYKMATYCFFRLTGQMKMLKYSDIGIWDSNFEVEHAANLVDEPKTNKEIYSNGFAMLQFAKLAYESYDIVEEEILITTGSRRAGEDDTNKKKVQQQQQQQQPEMSQQRPQQQQQQQQQEGSEFDNFDLIHLWGSNVYICSRHEKVFVFFRGTEPFHVYEWLTDSKFRFRLLKNPDHIGKGDEHHQYQFVHSGFMEALDVNGFKSLEICTWLQVIQRISKFANITQQGHEENGEGGSTMGGKISNPRIYITGHSLGGALATLFTKKLVEIGLSHHIAGLYTYGSPRVGNDIFKKHFEGELGRRMFRFVFAGDVVSKLPISTKDLEDGFDINAPNNPLVYKIAYWIFHLHEATEQYEHVGKRMELKREGVNMLERIFRFLVPVFDHTPYNYHKALAQLK